ncbi:hypothetical protein [Hirschia maritima]|uniref:hypothetical protein n=1 Tax=Hirschia maritima TaxID=1121961 RepID=UPI0003681C4E|nr:hypothetical protein [Hirschia maritima]
MRVLTSTALVLSFAIAGCSTTSKIPSLDTAVQTDAGALTYLTTMNEWSPKSSMTDEATWNAISSAENSIFKISFDNIETSENDVTAHNLKIALSSFPDVGLQVEHAKMWGFDASTLEALSENNPTKIADRIDLSNITYFGLTEIFEDLTNASNEATVSILEDVLEDEAGEAVQVIKEQQNVNVSKYDLGYGRITLDGLYWNGLAVPTLPKEDEKASSQEVWDFISSYARWSNAFKVDAMSMLDSYGEFAMEQTIDSESSQSLKVDYKVPVSGVIGYDKGNTRLIVYKGMDMFLDQNILVEDDDFPFNIGQGGTTGLLSVRDLNLSGLLSLLQQRKIPTLKDENLISLGKWHAEEMTSTIGDSIVSKTDTFDMDISEFRSFIPTKISMSVPSSNYNMVAFFDAFEDMFSTVFEAESEDFDRETFDQYAAQGMEIINKYELQNLDVGSKLNYEWDPDNGDLNFELDYKFKDLIGLELEFDGAAGDFVSFAEAFSSEDDSTRKALLEDILENRGALNNFRVKLTDDNIGLGRMFGMAIDFAKLIPEDEAGELAMLQSQTPENLRLMASSMMRMGAMAAKDEIPQAIGFANTFADFIEKGGDIEFMINPEKPLSKASIDEAKENGIQEPEQIIEFIGVGVSHTAPPEAE